MQDRGLEFADLLAIWSLLLGYQNLKENEEQSAHNDVQKANDAQAAYMLSELGRRFDEQNKMLRDIYEAVKNEGNQGSGGVHRRRG